MLFRGDGLIVGDCAFTLLINNKEQNIVKTVIVFFIGFCFYDFQN